MAKRVSVAHPDRTGRVSLSIHRFIGEERLLMRVPEPIADWSERCASERNQPNRSVRDARLTTC